MDRYQDQVTLTRSNWYDRLCCRVPESNTQVLPLSSIIGVQAVGTQGLVFQLTSGNSAPVITHPVYYRWLLCTRSYFHIISFVEETVCLKRDFWMWYLSAFLILFQLTQNCWYVDKIYLLWNLIARWCSANWLLTKKQQVQ